MKKLLLISSYILLTSLLCSCNSKTLEITVLDKDTKMPISNAYVYVRDFSYPIFVDENVYFTNKKGKIVVNVNDISSILAGKKPYWAAYDFLYPNSLNAEKGKLYVTLYPSKTEKANYRWNFDYERTSLKRDDKNENVSGFFDYLDTQYENKVK